MARITYTCPYCGAKFEADSSKGSVKCPYCDSEVNSKSPTEVPAIEGRSDTSSKKPVDKPWSSFDPAKETWAKAQDQVKNNANKKGKKHLGLWILGWIFCFPIPLTILLLRSKKLEPKVKYSLVAVLWIVVLIIGFIRSGKKNDAARDVSSEATAKQETSESEVEVKEPEIITANMVDVTGKKPDEAISLLNEAGFMNVTTDVDKMGDWNPDRIFVDEQSETPGTSVNVESEVFLSCKKICKLYIDVSSDANLFFDTYDMDIYLDGDTVGTVSNGQNITKLMEVVEGTHVIKAVNSGNDSKNASKSFEVDSDVTFSADIAHGGSIQFNNVNIVADISGSSLEVIDTKGMVLSDALSKLKEIGFTNVQYEPNRDIWDRSNWTVISQSIEAGTKTDKTTSIVLECKKTTSYVDEQLIGLTANQAIGKAGELGFTYSFLNGATQEDITETINGYSEDEQALWIVKDASGATSSEKKLSLSVVYTGNVTVPNLVGSNLKVAIDNLHQSQFSDVSSAASDNTSIFDNSNWTVIAQSIEPGVEHPANESIVLTCKKTVDYVGEQLVGLSAKEAIAKAGELGVSLNFINEATKEDITGNILAIPEDEQTLWFVQEAASGGTGRNSMRLTVNYTGNVNMPNLVGFSLEDAIGSLHNIQLSNVTYVANDGSQIYGQRDWAVVSQNIEPGTEVPANEAIELTCERIANSSVGTSNPSSTEKKSLNYTTNDSETAKQGNSGVFAYRQKDRGTYDIYLIVDFDERAVYDFTEGNGSNECLRYEMIQGDLNGTLVIQFNASDGSWQEGLCFKYQKQPLNMIRDVGDGWQIDYVATDLDSALKIKNQKTILTD